MDSYLLLATSALVFAFVVVVPTYAALLALVNVAYRVASGRFFRWMSWRTFAPLLVLFLGCAVFIFYTFTRPNAFVITH